MNGKELLEAMSFIDEELLAEAETPARRNGWRRWAAVAACLCILILGAFSFRQLSGGPTEGIADGAAPETALAAGAAQDSCSLTAKSAEEEPREAGTHDMADEADALHTARVRIIELTQEGFTALILTDERDLKGLTVTVIPEAGVDLSGVETEKEYDVWFHTSEEDGILRIWDIQPAEQEE